MSSTERNLLRIVGHNSMAHVPVGITDGEHSGFFNLRYYVVTENQSTCPITFITDNIKLSYKDDSDMTETGLESHAVFNTAIKNGASLNLALEPSVGFNIGLVRVVMNGMDITAECFNKNAKKISIPAVSGYVIITASGDANACYYGASSAKDICELNIDTLALTEGDLIGKTVTVGTTEEKPYVWFISRVESAFFQEGFEASMNSTHIGDLYYYWSDELISGDNTYTIKLK